MDTLKPKMMMSTEIYETALIVATRDNKESLKRCIEIPEFRPQNLEQDVNDFDAIYQDAEEANMILLDTFGGKMLRHKDSEHDILMFPDELVSWIDNAISPGLKGKLRAYMKMENDYGGKASLLKDLAQITLRFKTFM